MRSQALWTSMLKSSVTKESWRNWRSALRELGKSQSKEEWLRKLPGVELMFQNLESAPPPDPSLRDQLLEVRNFDPTNQQQLTDAYLDAIRKAPDASEATKRKWRKAARLA